MAPSTMIETKLNALLDELKLDEKPRVFAFDCEWDTHHGPTGLITGKDGQVALMQVAFRHDDKVKALLFQLPHNEKVPSAGMQRIRTFLTNENAMFIGV